MESKQDEIGSRGEETITCILNMGIQSEGVIGELRKKRERGRGERDSERRRERDINKENMRER